MIETINFEKVEIETKELDGGSVGGFLETLVVGLTGGLVKAPPVYESILTDASGNEFQGYGLTSDESEEKARDAYRFNSD